MFSDHDRRRLPSFVKRAYLGLALLGFATGASAADWPRFLGPTANGVSTETGLIEKWPAKGPPTVWARPVGTGYSAPSVRGNLVVVHHRSGGNEIVEACNVANGREAWHYAYPSAFEDPYGYNNGPRCTP